MASSKIYYGVTVGAGGEIKKGKKNRISSALPCYHVTSLNLTLCF
jgi:hypothetical protein